MKRVILYGAGVRGIKTAKLLAQKDINIAGFFDIYSNEDKIIIGEEIDGIREVPVWHDVDIKNKSEYIVIITIADQKARKEAESLLLSKGFLIEEIENLLDAGNNRVEQRRNLVKLYHIDNMEEYFDNSEKEESLQVFWEKNSPFFKLFQRLNTERIIELACGRGRHVTKYISQTEKVVLVDILDKNIEYCKDRFRKFENVDYYVNNGYDLSDLQSDYYTALFTYDAMVHFELMDIYQYLLEAYRVLKIGGRALFHHSNNHSDYKLTFSNAQCGRNYMSKDLFAYLAYRAGFEVLEQKIIHHWSENLDCITLVEKK